MAQPTEEDFRAAVRLRGHQAPCTEATEPCGCGAARERALIAQALAEERERTEARVHQEIAQRGIRSVPLSADDLLETLAGMRNVIHAGDSYGGWIEYDSLGGEPCPLCQGMALPECTACHGTGERELPEGTDFWVRGLYRTGNAAGQGGVRIVGEVPGAEQTSG